MGVELNRESDLMHSYKQIKKCLIESGIFYYSDHTDEILSGVISA